MRFASENKAVQTVPHGATCLGQHKGWLGTACPSCGTDIPYGPYTFAEHRRLFGGPINEPVTRTPSPAFLAAQAEYVAADRERSKAYAEVVRLEEALALASMSTTDFSVLGQQRDHAPDPVRVARLTEKLAQAREAREAADDRTAKALKASHRVKA